MMGEILPGSRAFEFLDILMTFLVRSGVMTMTGSVGFFVSLHGSFLNSFDGFLVAPGVEYTLY